MSRQLVFDIETDNLLTDISKIHCISTIDIETGEDRHFGPHEIQDGLNYLSSADTLIGHNICSFDIPAIKKLYPKWKYTAQLYDTLLAGCILLPEEGILSLEAWAKKLKLKQEKVQHEDWSKYSMAMRKRCDGDVSINEDVYYHLVGSKGHKEALSGLALEQKVALIHASQAEHGVRFDVLGAISLMHELDEEIGELYHKLVDDAPWRCEILGVAASKQELQKKGRTEWLDTGVFTSPPPITINPTQALKKNGEHTQLTKSYFGEDNVEKVQGPYTKVAFKGLNPDSDIEIKKLLLDLGWKPTEWNIRKDKVTGETRVTSPKLTEDSFSSLPDGLGADVARYKMLTHRRRFLLNKDRTKGALINVQQRTGRVRSDAFTCGTPTSRYRHQGTVCNIPRPSTPYGKEIRSLFTVPEGAWMVGVDLSGIEARMLAHYLLEGNYPRAKETAQLILSPDKGNDFHTYNAKAWSVSRDIAKNGLYALMYGAGAKKLANTLGKPEGMGTKLKKDFFKAHPGIEALIKDLESAFSARGYIYGLDGRPLFIRGANKLLNSLLQNAAAMVFKKWMVAVDEVRLGWATGHNTQQIIAYHDELQFECRMDKVSATAFGEAIVRCAQATGKEMKIRVPIDAEAKVGKNWKDTH